MNHGRKYKSPSEIGKLYDAEAQYEAELDAVERGVRYADEAARYERFRAANPDFMREVDRERREGWKPK